MWSAQYGSGILSPECAGCGGQAHLSLDVAIGRVLTRPSSISLIVRNVLNDRYAVTATDELQGPHYSMPRSFELNLTMGE